MNEMTFKLYSPLTAEFRSARAFWRGEGLTRLRGRELIDYAVAISAEIAEFGADLAQYLDAERAPYLAAHVKSIRISVDERGGELCGCATVTVDKNLTERGWNDLQDYLTGQYADGWGECFEQRDIEVVNGVLNVHFWQPTQLAFTTVQMARMHTTIGGTPCASSSHCGS